MIQYCNKSCGSVTVISNADLLCNAEDLIPYTLLYHSFDSKLKTYLSGAYGQQSPQLIVRYEVSAPAAIEYVGEHHRIIDIAQPFC